MAGPWEKYKKQTPAVAVGEDRIETPTAGKPWERFAKPVVVAPETTPEPEVVEQGMLLPISKDADGNTHFDSDAGLLGALKRSFMLPGEVMSGKVDPTSPEGIERAFEFVGTVSPAGAAQRAVGGSVRQAARVAAEKKGSLGRRLVTEGVDDPALARQRYEDMTAIGAEPTSGMVSGGSRAMTKEQALAQTRQGKVIQDRIEGAFGAMDDEFNRVVDGVTSRTNPGAKTNSRQELGSMLRDQAQAAKDAALDRSVQLYDNVTDLTKGVAAEGKATREYLATLTATKKGLTESDKINIGSLVDDAIKRTKAISDDIAKGKADFNKLREERTRISGLLYDRNLDPAQKKYLEGLRDSLTKDMERTADKAGPDALQAFRKANNQYRRFKDSEIGFGKKSPLTRVTDANADPETIYKYALDKSKEGGTRLNALRRQIDRDEGKAVWDNLAGSVVERMGKDTTIDGLGDFNPTKFMREWKGMSDEAKNTLFKGTDRQTYRNDLDRLARIADNMQKYQRKANHSNTQNHNTLLGEMNPMDKNTLLGAALGGWKGAVLVGAGKAANSINKKYQSRLLTDPKTVKWLADIPKAEMAKGGLKSHLGKLRDMARDEAPGSALAIAINEYLDDIGEN